MSMPDEVYRSICRAGFLLTDIMMDRKSKYSKEARMVLRHFPGIVELEGIFNGGLKEHYAIISDSWKAMADERNKQRQK